MRSFHPSGVRSIVSFLQAMSYLIWLLGVAILQMVNSIPCYTETKSSNAMNIRHGPFLVTQQNECALACSCASQVNQSSDDCTVFTPKIPNVECHAYSYDFESRQCKLLGGEQESVSTEQVTIYERGNCTANPKCGSTTLDTTVMCDSEGYRCPEDSLPYIFSEQSGNYARYIGAYLINFDGEYDVWYTNSTEGPFPCDRNYIQNITCKPAPSTHSHDACNFNGTAPSLINALMLKDTFGCFPGFKYSSTTNILRTKKVTTVPVCTAKGWLEKAGGIPIDATIRIVTCDKIV